MFILQACDLALLLQDDKEEMKSLVEILKTESGQQAYRALAQINKQLVRVWQSYLLSMHLCKHSSLLQHVIAWSAQSCTCALQS